MESHSHSDGHLDTRWLHRECGACGASFRLRRGLGDATVECPFCDAPTPAASDVSPTAAVPPPLPIAITPPSTRTKKKSLPAAPRAREIPPAPTLSPRTATAVSAPPSKAAPRSRLRRPPSKPGRYLSVAALAGLSVALVIGLVSFLKKGNTVPESLPPASVQAPPNPSATPPRPTVANDSLLTNEDCQSALQAVRHCFAAATIEEMLPYVRQPEAVRPLMEKWYAALPHEPVALGKLLRARIMEVNGGVRLLVLDIKQPDGKSDYYVVEQTPEAGMKVDWEVSARYQEMPLPEFQSTRPMSGTPFRVHAMISDYYNYDFDDSERYLCLELTYPGDPTFKLWGYAERESGAGIRLASLLEFGASSLILDLRYPQGPQSRSSEQVEITALRQSSWFR